MQVKLTENRIAALKPGPKAYTVRDAQVTGFFIDVNRGGTKSFKLQADLWVGERGARSYAKTVRHTLGRFGEMPLDVARARASELIARIKSGQDPFAQKEPEKKVWTVAEAYAEYVADLRSAGRSERTGRDMLYRLDRYIPDWKARAITEIEGTMAREAHRRITRDHGPRCANQTLAEFARVFRLAQRTFGARNLPDLPTAGVKHNDEEPKKRSIADLPRWWARVESIPNPSRRAMQQLGLLSGLRPGNLCAIRLDWIDLERPCIRFPADVMKMRRPFELPLSPAMVDIVKTAMAAAKVQEPTSAWLFPTRTLSGAVVHTGVWRDRALRVTNAEGKVIDNLSGHWLRHTYSNLAKHAGLAESDVMMLMGHKLAGIRDTYTDEVTQFPRLLRLQAQVSAYVLKVVAP